MFDISTRLTISEWNNCCGKLFLLCVGVDEPHEENLANTKPHGGRIKRTPARLSCGEARVISFFIILLCKGHIVFRTSPFWAGEVRTTAKHLPQREDEDRRKCVSVHELLSSDEQKIYALINCANFCSFRCAHSAKF